MTEAELEREMVHLMERADIDPALIYAFKKTGRMVTEQNAKLLQPEDIKEWTDAIEEYRRLNP